MLKLRTASLAIFVSLFLGVLPAQDPKAEILLRNGKIVTVDPALGTVEALAIANGRILAVGSNAELLKYVDGPMTQVIDLDGKLAIPGFIEGHGHFAGLGDSLRILNLAMVNNWEEVIAMVEAAVASAAPGEWILGRGWHQEKWDHSPIDAIEGFPTHEALSKISPNNPVSLTHASGHAAFFNAKAMEMAGVDEETADPPGGEIIKDAAGKPIGVFRERAQSLVRGVYRTAQLRRSAQDQEDDLRLSLQLADQECLSKGVTSFQDAGTPFSTLDVVKKMTAEGELGTRLWFMIRDSNANLERNLAKYRTIGADDEHLTIRAVKRTIDGALGPRGAWLLEPYSDSPESTGLATATIESVTETARIAAENDYQVCVHAIGDRANREVLNIFEAAFAKMPDKKDLRWRIEHAQHINAADIPRFAKLGVVASMQGIHCTSDAPYVVPRLGEERAEEGAYVWQKLMASGALVTNGTDAPVEDVDPIASYQATVSRRMKDGRLFYPEQRMSRMEALESYTINAAKAAFEEHIKGSLNPGKLADIVVLSEDIMTVPEEEITKAKVLYTIVGGKILYQAGN
ncbi:MAG: amidohydrolase [Planctomycetota bacterium]